MGVETGEVCPSIIHLKLSTLQRTNQVKLQHVVSMWPGELLSSAGDVMGVV